MQSLLLVSAILGAATVLSAATFKSTDRIIPLVQDGGGSKTSVTVLNLSSETALFELSFRPKKGFLENWELQFNAPDMKVTGSAVSGSVAPGASVTIETTGTAKDLTRGYAVVNCFNNKLLAAVARVESANGTLTITAASELDTRFMLPIESSADVKTEIVWVSESPYAEADCSFRDSAGKVVASDRFSFGTGDLLAQVTFSVADRYPDLKAFRGVMECKVTFPNAGMYDELTFSALAIRRKGSEPASAIATVSASDWQ